MFANCYGAAAWLSRSAERPCSPPSWPRRCSPRAAATTPAPTPTRATTTPPRPRADEAPEVEQFTGSLDDFYVVPDPLPEGEPGELIRTMAVSEGDGATTLRIMYHSRDAQDRDRAVTGHPHLPGRARRPRAAGRSSRWAHGTTGIAPTCAPSRGDGAAPGFGIEGVHVATDYIGLGPVGELHPYLSRLSEGNSVIDAVRAARNCPRRPAPASAGSSIGASQGGHGAMAAAELAADHAPELELVGTVAIAPGAVFDQSYGMIDAVVVEVIKAIALYGAPSDHPEIDPADYFTPEALAGAEAVMETACLGEITSAMLPAAPAVRQRPGHHRAVRLRHDGERRGLRRRRRAAVPPGGHGRHHRRARAGRRPVRPPVRDRPGHRVPRRRGRRPRHRRHDPWRADHRMDAGPLGRGRPRRLLRRRMSARPLTGRRVLITGAARGIGAALAERLHQRGARVALAGLEPELLGDVAERCGGAPWTSCDVTDRDQVDAAVATAVEGLGGLDVVVANAGIAAQLPHGRRRPRGDAPDARRERHGRLPTRCGPPVRTSATGRATRWPWRRWAPRCTCRSWAPTAPRRRRSRRSATRCGSSCDRPGRRVGVAYFAELDTDMTSRGFATEAADASSPAAGRSRR